MDRYDLHAEYRFTEVLEAYLDVANLTDEETFYYGGPWDENVGYGRTIWVGLRSKF